MALTAKLSDAITATALAFLAGAFFAAPALPDEQTYQQRAAIAQQKAHAARQQAYFEQDTDDEPQWNGD